MKSLPRKRVLRQVDVFDLLSRKVAEDCMRAGWLKPRARTGGQRSMKLFALDDVHRCEDRILEGEYPTPTK